MNNKFIIILLFCNYLFSKDNILSKPIITSGFNGAMLGNRLFNYCFGKIIAQDLNYNLEIGNITGFPNTFYKKNNINILLNDVLHINDVNLSSYLDGNNEYKILLPKCNIYLDGYFQKYEYYKPYKDLIKNDWLKLDEDIIPHEGLDDILVHVRIGLQAVYPKKVGFIPLNSLCYLPFEYYKKALSMTKYNKVYICADDPDDVYLDNFKQYNPIIIRHKNSFCYESTLSDFKFIMSFNKIIMAQSTFSWWAAWLSNATEIYAPITHNGIMRENQEIINLKVDDEPRYTYIIV